MVGFVLDDYGGEAADRLFTCFESVAVDIADDQAFGTEYVTASAGNRKTAFAAESLFFRKTQNLRIYKYLKRFTFHVEALDCDDAAEDADLRCSDADALVFRVAHCREHALF